MAIRIIYRIFICMFIYKRNIQLSICTLYQRKSIEMQNGTNYVLINLYLMETCGYSALPMKLAILINSHQHAINTATNTSRQCWKNNCHKRSFWISVLERAKRHWIAYMERKLPIISIHCLMIYMIGIYLTSI